MKMQWRLGLDMGTSSLGWWAFRITQEKVNGKDTWIAVESLGGGVRIFSEGREPSKGGRVGDSLAVGRRLSRGMRRNRDHGKNRMKVFMDDLIRLKLMPQDPVERSNLFQSQKGKPDTNNPYYLRTKAAQEKVTPHELGRVLFHLGLRRGFKSNRKEASDDDGGLLKDRMDALRDKLGTRTLGQYLWDQYQQETAREAKGENRRGIRFRGDIDFYPDRAKYEAEFNAIRKQQCPHHSLSEHDWDELLKSRILFQWPLRPVERGTCEFFADQPRHWKDTPVGHDFRIYQELNALKWIDGEQVSHNLDAEQRAIVLDALLSRRSQVKCTSMRKLKRKDKTPLFPIGSSFNLEGEKRKALNPHKFSAFMGDDPLLAPLWRQRGDDGMLDDVFALLHGAEDDDQARHDLAKQFSFGDDVINALVAFPLSSGTYNVSRKFMERIVPVLVDQGLVYADAVSQLCDDQGNALHHSMRDDGQRWDRLPYYGEVMPQSMLGADCEANPLDDAEKHFGKINNPTVHVALNQLRKLVNVLVDRFGGAPLQVHVELTRDLKLPRKLRDEISKDQGKNERNNERIFKDIFADLGITDPSALDYKRVKLWEELGKDQLARSCVFSGQTISAADLFNGAAEIEHILPFSRTLDGSMANLTVAKRWANRLKGHNTPHEAFSTDIHADKGCVWDEILQRAEGLPQNKRWRFGPNALERYEKDGGFIARQLTDTAYMSRASQRYLKSLKGVDQVVPNRGSLTALVRGKWGLNGILSDDNRKTREDHRHHAVDAAVIALTDRAVLQNVSQLTARGADDRIRLGVPKLDEGLAAAIRDQVRAITISFKPDHGLLGRMYKDTAYGFVDADKRDSDLPEHNLVTRKELVALTPKECEAIRDPKLRSAVRHCLYEAKAVGEKHDKALAAFTKENGVKRVRILIKNQTVIPIPSANYKGYTVNCHLKLTRHWHLKLTHHLSVCAR